MLRAMHIARAVKAAVENEKKYKDITVSIGLAFAIPYPKKGSIGGFSRS